MLCVQSAGDVREPIFGRVFLGCGGPLGAVRDEPPGERRCVLLGWLGRLTRCWRQLRRACGVSAVDSDLGGA